MFGGVAAPDIPLKIPPGQPVVGATLVVALPRYSMEKQEIAVPSTLFPNLTNKNTCPTLSISGCQAAHSHDNEEMAQNGAIWRKYNKRKPCRFSNLPCARCPGRSRELYDNEKNATECNTMQQIFKKSWLDGSSPLPALRLTRRRGNPCGCPSSVSTHFHDWWCRRQPT